MYKCGSIILLNNKKGIFPFLIRFFTRSKYTHNAIIMGKIIPDSESILTAEPLITVHPLQRYFENENYDFQIYEWKGIEENELEEIILELYEERVSRGYAYWQKLWYVYRYIVEIFKVDVRNQGNWFPNNDDCSEEAYDLMKLVAQKKRFMDLLMKLEEWNSNCFSPADSKLIFEMFPQYFIRVK